MDRELEEFVWRRAGGLCEYCRMGWLMAVSNPSMILNRDGRGGVHRRPCRLVRRRRRATGSRACWNTVFGAGLAFGAGRSAVDEDRS